MEKTIKYLENGEYHYATVRDVGDLAKLKTDSKDDLVAAINDLFDNGGKNAGKPEGYDKLVDNVAGAIQKQQQMSSTITNMQQTAQLSDAEMAHMKQVQEELRQEYLKAIKELNEAVEKAKADAAALDKKTNDMQDKIDETFADVNKEVSDIHKQLDAEAKGLHKDLDETKTNLEATRKDLLNSTQEYGQVHSDVQELQDKFNRRVWSTDLDPVREQVSKNSTEVQQTKDELKNKADQSNLDLVTNSVENLSAQVKQNASGLEVAVKRDELGGDVSRLLNDKTNLLLGTRSFSGEDNWKNRDAVTIEPGYYKGLKSVAVQVTDRSIYQPYHVKANTAYTFSFFGKEDKDNPKATLIIKPIDAPNINIDNAEQPVHITTEWQRFAVTFSADQDCDISIQIIQGPEASNNILHLAGFKLQYGQNNTPWEPNEADVAENIEHNESQFNVYSDQIAGIVKKQEKMGDTERQLDTRITETAEGLKQTSKDLQDANGKITEFKGQLESTARGLKTEYEKYTNDAIGQISDSSLNLIRNSAFQNKDDNFAQWQNVSAKANIHEDGNGLRWVELTQSGMTTDNPQGITSNYFVIKQGKVTVAVDIKLGDKANLDNQNILLLELYNDNKQRVDFTDVSVSQLGLSTAILNDHSVHRGLYRLGIDRKDVKYMTVKAILHRNGDLWLTNFSARLSSIDDGGYTPNPDDINHQILKMNTKIEEDAEHIALKANSVDVTRDIKSAVQNSNGGRNLLQGTGTASGDVANGSGTFVKGAFNGYDAVKTNTAWQGRFINLKSALGRTNAKAGDWYTISVYIKADKQIDTSSLDVYRAIGSNWGSSLYGISMQTKHITTQWQQYAWSFQIDDNSLQQQNTRVEYNSDTGDNWIYWAGWMLEKGTVAHDWSPAPEDTSAEIKSAKDAAIQVASDQINLHVNELSTSFDDKLNKRVNEVKTASEKFTSDGIEQTVRKITDVKNDVSGLGSRIDNLQVGGRNLVRNTDTDIVIDDTGNTGTQGWHFATINLTQQPKVGDQITVSAEGTLTGKGNLGTYDVILYNSTTSNARSNSKRLSSGKRASATLQVNNLDGNGDTVLLIYAGNISDTEGKKNTVHHLKVEFGNLATDWTPAPEDVDSKFQYKEVAGVIDFNDLKTQQKIFYQDVHAQNAPAGSNYWYFLNVDVIPGSGRIVQTATSDRNNITWKRTFADSWTAWQKQATQGDVDALRTETTASVKNLGDRVTTEVNSITSKVNSNNGGGINLQVGTDDCSFPIGNNGHEVNIENYSGTTKMIHSQNGGFYTDWSNKTFVPTVGETYTISADVKGDGTLDSNGFRYEGGTNAEFKIITLSDKWQRFSNTVKVDKISGQWVIYPANSKNLYVKHIKIERGTVATPWSPAPEDANEAINSLNTKWDVANGQIQGKVTETQVQDLLNRGHYATQEWSQGQINLTKDQFNVDIKKVTSDLNSRVNEVKTASEKFTSDGIEQTVRKITDVKNQVDDVNDKVNNLKVGGRNLLTNTNKDISVTSHTTDGYPAWAFVKTTFIFEHGKTYTFSTEARNSTNKVTEASIRVFDGSTNTQVGIYAFPADGNRHSVTFTVPNDNHNYYLYYYAGHAGINPGVDVTTTYHHPKLELGNMATDWTPAPEDVDSKFQYKEVAGVIDFNDLKTQQKIFYQDVHAQNAPAGSNYWYFLNVDVIPGSGRIVQTATSDRNNITWKRTFADSWTAWQKQATQGDVDALRTETTASVKNLGDRVTTEVNSVTTKINDSHTNDVELVRKSDFSDGKVGGWSGTDGANRVSVVEVSDIPDGLGTKGIKVLKTTDRDAYEYDIWYSVKPGEKFDVDFWMQPPSNVSAQFGLVFVDANKQNYNWIGIPVNAGTGWSHYSKTIEAPSGKVFAKPWFNIEKNSSNTDITALLAKPSIRRHDNFTEQKINEINTKLDVANGQIQGKVTATDVNNILNGKGYATQSWAQTMFTMKSDAITLQAVRDNITNGIQNQVNDTRNQVKGLQNQFNTQTGINLLKGTADFSGPWFNKNGKGWSYSEWQPPTSENKSERNNNVVYQDSGHAWDGLGQTVELDTGEYTFSMWMWPTLSGNESMNIYAGDSQYGGTAKVNFSGYCYSASQPQNRWILVKTYLTVTQGGKLSIRPELNQASGTIYVASYMLQHGHVENPVWAPAPDDLAPKSIISSINITPDQIKIASNKIEIDGNTYIHGDLQAQDVRLVGKRGAMDLSGDKGLLLSNNDGSEVAINENGLGLKYKNDFSMDINSSLLTLSKRNAALDQPEPIAFGNIGSVMKGHDPKVNGFMLRYNPGALNDLKKRGATFMSFGYNTPDIGNVVSQIELYGQDTEINVQDSGKTTKRTQRKGIHIQDALEFDTNTSVRFPQAHDHLFLHSEKWDISQQAGYYQPSIRLVSDGGSLGNAGVTFQWDAIKPFGAVDMTDARLWVYGVDHGIKNVWVSWSNWDGGERYPALVNDIGYWGGIAFPKSGRVTLFDADGRYYTPDRNTGIGAYNNYIGKNNNWH